MFIQVMALKAPGIEATSKTQRESDRNAVWVLSEDQMVSVGPRISLQGTRVLRIAPGSGPVLVVSWRAAPGLTGFSTVMAGARERGEKRGRETESREPQ